MPSILIHFDEATWRALDRVVAETKGGKSEFIRQAVEEAIRKREFEKIREAYFRQPDTSAVDDWSTAEEFIK